MSNKVSRLARILCVLGVLYAGSAWASVGGSITGTIKDPAGRVIPNAEVLVRETGKGIIYQARTNSGGHYTFPVLPVGHYELNVQASGFSSYQRTDIVLDTNA